MALRGGAALAMNERHMRRVLASECVDGVEPDPALVRRWSRRTFDAYARYWATAPACPTRARPACAPASASTRATSTCGPPWTVGRGIVMALPHVGSWEWGGYWLALEGMPMTAVVERLEPEELFEWFVGAAGRHGTHRGAAGRGLELGAAAGAQGEARSPGW